MIDVRGWKDKQNFSNSLSFRGPVAMYRASIPHVRGRIFGFGATLWLLAADHVSSSHGQEPWTTPELAPPLLTTTPYQREDVLALDRFNLHRCPTRRVFSGTGFELMTRLCRGVIAVYRVLQNSSDKFRRMIVGPMGTTNHYRTWVLQTTFSRTNLQKNYEWGCVDWNEKEP
ncbi:uncharacterized protein TNCV_2792061 [Trichonephila clavipes]|nr:uncharacterized protein TNCV_2792061 [Trichonephila clavipes]